MCGIAGIAGKRAVNRDAIAQMIGQMAHRGPDGEGLWSATDGRLVLGHRRLAVIDPSEKGAQPMTDVAGDLCITFNGEIYNYVELAERLKGLGAVFRSASDTEVILAAYAAWGPECVQELNGMFAFAIFDRARNSLFCARDRFGEKPFLFAEGDGYFAFASEYKALLPLVGVAGDPNDAMLLRFLRRPADGLDHQRETIFSGISQILAGEALTLDLATLAWKSHAYWRAAPDPDISRLADIDAVAAFRETLTDAVRIRLRSDVPLGSCLSGGLDSSSIVAISRALLGDDAPYHVFTGRFPGSPGDEGKWAGIMAGAAAVVCHETAPTGADLARDLDHFLWRNELPVDSTSQYAQWRVFKLAAEEGITVLLDGQGADEVLGGYEQYFAYYLDDLAAADPAAAAAEEAAIRARYPGALAMRDQAWKKHGPLAMRRLAARVLGRGGDILFGVRPEFADEHSGAAPPVSLAEALERDACNGFLTTLLRYGDRNSMAWSREVRLPFCDHRLIAISLAVAPRVLMGGAQTKRLIRDAMQDLLPEKIRNRWNKQGFLPPQDDWFQGGLIDAAEELFNDPSFAASPLWDAGWWQRCAKRFRRGETALAHPMWKPFVAEHWRRAFVQRTRQLPRLAPLAGGA